MQGNPSSNITSIPYTFVLGLLTACWSLTGYDSAVHGMCFELERLFCTLIKHVLSK